jgi:V-type H+-transporting ATPase subunit C
LSTLSEFLVPDNKAKHKKDGSNKKKKESNNEEAMGEFASVMEGEYHDFVVFEIEKVDE